MANEFDNINKITNTEIEEVVLGAIILDPGAISKLDGYLLPQAFSATANKLIYEAALTLYKNSCSTDLYMIAHQLEQTGQLDRIGGRGRLIHLLKLNVATHSLLKYAEILMQLMARRNLHSFGYQCMDVALETRVNSLDAFAKIDAEFFKLNTSNLIQKGRGIVHISKALESNYSEASSRHNDGILVGIPVGFRDLDAVLNSGFQKTDFIIVAGRPAMGKTAYALCAIKHIATTLKLPVVMFSIEMSCEQLTMRMISQHSGIKFGQLRTGRISDTEWGVLAKTIEDLADLPIFLDDSPNITVNYIRSQLLKLKAEYGDLGIVVIDYLQLMDATNNNENRVQELSKITRSLKALAREINTPIMALSQLHRGVEGRMNKRPVLSDLKETGSIEQDSDIVMMLYRDEYYNPDTPDRGVAEVIISKYRNGPTGTVKLLFDAEYTLFKDLPH